MGRVGSIRYGYPEAVWEGSAVLVLTGWAGVDEGGRHLLSGLVIYVAGIMRSG